MMVWGLQRCLPLSRGRKHDAADYLAVECDPSSLVG